MNNSKELSGFEEDLDSVLEVTLSGMAEKKCTQSTITSNLARECFGVEMNKGNEVNQKKKTNRRENEIKWLRKQINALNRKFKVAEAEKKD